MEFVKNHLFWIVLGVVVLVSLGVYGLITPGVTESANKAKEESLSKASAVHSWATKSGTDELKNQAHVEQAKEYRQKVKGQVETLLQTLQKQKLEQKFTNVPTGDLQFDGWLNERRTALQNAANDAKLQLPSDFDRLMFVKDSTSKNASDPTRHREFRLNQVAIIDEVVNILCKIKGKQKVSELQLNGQQAENSTTVDVGALALERVAILTAKDTADRMKLVMTDVGTRAGAQGAAKGAIGAAPSAASAIKELPVTVTAVDIQFVAPLNVVPTIVQALETSQRYAAVATRFDLQRAAPAVPTLQDMVAALPSSATTGEASATPPAAPAVSSAAQTQIRYANTHFREGPVRVLVTLELYEYDKTKEAGLKTALK